MITKLNSNGIIRLIVESGKATPSPPIGPSLGSRGIKAIDFCKLFNSQTSHIETSLPLRVKIKLDPSSSSNNNNNKSFQFTIHPPPTSYFFLKALQISKGASNQPSQSNLNQSTNDYNFIGQLSLKFIYHLALLKQSDPDLGHISLESLCRSLVAQARNMGIQVIP